jgi:hypothetical protein
MATTALVIQAIAQQNPNGVSIDVETGRIVDGPGFCVAYAATQNQFGAGGAQFALNHATGPNGSGIVGAWLNNADNNYYFDSVKKYITREAAVEAAKREQQIALYDLQRRVVEDIMTSGVNAVPGSPGTFAPALGAAGRKRAHSF